jgi:hypothetical protein
VNLEVQVMKSNDYYYNKDIEEILEVQVMMLIDYKNNLNV